MLTEDFTIRPNQFSKYASVALWVAVSLVLLYLAFGGLIYICIEKGQWEVLILPAVFFYMAGFVLLLAYRDLKENDQLTIGGYDIYLQRTNYKLSIKFKVIQEILLFRTDEKDKGWIFVRKNNGRTIPIDLSMFYFNCDSLKQELNSRLIKYNVSVSETTSRDEVESILRSGTDIPADRAYTVRNNRGAKYFFAIGLVVVAFCACVCIYNSMSEVTATITSLLVLVLLGLPTYYLFKRTNNGDVYMVIDSKGVWLNKRRITWDQVTHLKYEQNGKYSHLYLVTLKGKCEIEDYDPFELAEQLAYYSKRLITYA